jgi:hypothetical protein
MSSSSLSSGGSSSDSSSDSEKSSSLPDGGGGNVDDSSSDGEGGCPDIEISAMVVVMSGTNPSGSPCFPAYSIEPQLVQVFITVTVTNSTCPNSYVNCSFAGNGLGSQPGGFNGNGTYYFNTTLNAFPLQEFGIVACYGTSNSISNKECDGLLCCSYKNLKMPDICGE